MKLIRFLVVRANGDMRIVTRRPRLSVDEFAYRLTVNVPNAPAYLGDIELTVPEWPKPGEAQVTVVEETAP
jgi:hypothetical protein